MKNIAKFIKKHDNIFAFILIALIMLGKVYNIGISNTDEMYNFFNSYKLANGLTIYADNNVIITPLFFYISSIILKIFGENILVFRTINLIVSSSMFFLCYLILKELKVNKKFSLLYTLLIITLISSIISGGANYITLSYTFYLLGFLLIIKMKKGTLKSIIQGLILFLVFLSYQKLGAGYFIAIVAYEIINKDAKSLLKELFTAFILLISFLAYLYTQNNLLNFIDYAILGISEFGSKNWIIEGNIFSILLFLMLPIMTLIAIIAIAKATKANTNNQRVNNENISQPIPKNQNINFKYTEIKKQSLSIFSFSICAYIIIVPILNIFHIYMASILMIINLMNIICYLLKPILEEKCIKTIINTIIVCIIILFLTYSTSGMWKYLNKVNNIPKDSHFYGAIIDEELKKTILEVGEYVKNNNKNTIVLSTYAPLISLYLNDLDNGDYDLPLRGNFGSKGEKGVLEKIKKLENTQILLLHETDKEKEIYQFAYNIADYIKQNYTYIGQINKFDIYETKK